MDIKIIKPQEKHIEQMVKLADDSRQYHIDIMNGYFKPVTPVSSGFEEKAIRTHMSEPENNIIFIAVDQHDTVLGMIMGEKVYKPWLQDSHFGHVSNIIVSSNARRQGIGKKLMDALVQECKQSGVQEIDLGVYNSNTAAYDFYIEYGFKPIKQSLSIKL